MEMDTVPCHPPRSWHPRESQRAVAVLTDVQILGADDLLSCKKRKERPLVWIMMVSVLYMCKLFIDGLNILNAEKALGIGGTHSG